MDVSELLMPHQGGPSPFGDDQTFPLPPGHLVYNHPKPGKDHKSMIEEMDDERG
jgi:succinate dehydrogenase / fumarate reductase iron-sulfur subunit